MALFEGEALFQNGEIANYREFGHAAGEAAARERQNRIAVQYEGPAAVGAVAEVEFAESDRDAA